ncbi:MAG: sigma-70 family RNA polymerase sigma factor [Candidatus Hydrogenedentes bacterium]|nr:sigma-70 family RNA polymerase sigma factor [Candidatus Hydrogenedentota bacterium]
MQKSDTALMERWIAARDPEAFAQLVDRHAGMVLAVCRRVLGNHADAEETAQECFLQVSQAQRAVAPSMGGWLHRLATNRALDRLRSDTARAARERNYAAEQSGSTEPTWNDIQPHVDAIIAQLADELQAPLVLHFFEGHTHREVARALGIGRSTVTERIQRAIVEIREQLAAKHITLGLAALSALFGTLEVSAAPPAFVASLKKIGIATGRSAPPTGLPLKWRAVAVAGAIAVLVAALWVSNTRANARSGRDASTVIETDVEAGGEGPTGAYEEVAEVITPVAEAADISLARGDVVEAATPEAEKPEMLRLRCVDEEGKPVAGAEVYYVKCAYADTPTPGKSDPKILIREPFGPTNSDTDGFVKVPAVEDSAEFYQAYARVPNALVGTWGYRPTSQVLDWSKTITMVKSTRIAGTVRVPNGMDPSQVDINVLTVRIGLGVGRGGPFEASSKYRPSFWPEVFSTRPARDGAFSIGDLPTGHSYYLAFTGAGLGEAQRFDFNANGETPLDVEMFPEATISGTVRYAAGGPAADVPVFAHPFSGQDMKLGFITAFETRTDALGRYTFKGLPDVSYSVLARHDGNPPSGISPVVPILELLPGSTQKDIDITIEQGALQEGTVTDKLSGDPIVGARLVALNPADEEYGPFAQAIGNATTDAEGKFAFRLPVGVSQIYISEVPEEFLSPDQQNKTLITVASGDTRLQPVTFQLAKKSEAELAPAGTATLECRVIDAEGRPLAGVPMAIERKYKHGESNHQTQTPSRPTGEDGRFSIANIATGEYQLVVGGGTYSRISSEWFAVEADETKSLGDIAVERYDQKIVVNIEGFNEATTVSRPDVIVKVRDTDEYIADAQVDASGRVEFHVPNLPLVVSGGQEGYKYFEVDAEPDTEMEIALEPEEGEPDGSGSEE